MLTLKKGQFNFLESTSNSEIITRLSQPQSTNRLEVFGSKSKPYANSVWFGA